VPSADVKTNPIDRQSLLLFREVILEVPECISQAKKSLSEEELANLLGHVLIIAASINNLKAVQFILDSAESNIIAPNGEAGLGRVVCLASDIGSKEIVERTLQHPNAKFIFEDGPFSLKLASSTALTAKAYSLRTLLDGYLSTRRR